MSVVKEKTLTDYCSQNKFRLAAEPLKAWVYETKHSDWNSAGELKLKYRSASIISSKRVVFNIKGNNYRLIVDIEFKLKIVFIVWLGTHEDYDKIDAKMIRYEN